MYFKKGLYNEIPFSVQIVLGFFGFLGFFFFFWRGGGKMWP